MRLNISEILEATKGRLISGSGNEVVTGISTDTRTIKNGDLFIALKGRNFDGHGFIDEAIKKKAAGAIVQVMSHVTHHTSHVPRFTIIQVPDTLKALGDIAHYYRMKFDIPFVGITGSNGKTTVKEMVYMILSFRFQVLKNEGTENNLIGVPKTLFKLDTNHNIAVLELGTNHFGEIKALSSILNPSVGIITNIGATHLEFLGSKEGVLKEKFELVNALGEGDIAILNADDEYLSRIKNLKANVVRFGIQNNCDFRATKIVQQDEAIEFVVNEKYNFRINLLGRQNIYNALAATAVGFLYKLDYRNIYNGLLEFRPVNGRLCLKKIEGIDVIDDTYNSNPQSVKASIEALAAHQPGGKDGKRIFVCGDMLELGSWAARFHGIIGKMVSEAKIDCLISVGKFSEIVRDSAIQNGMAKKAVFVCKDNTAVLESLKKIVKEGDVVLLKGSRRMKLDEVVDALPSFISAKRGLVRI